MVKYGKGDVMKEKIKITNRDIRYYLDSETICEMTHKALHRCNATWLTNGHWMVRRSAVYASEATMKVFNDSDVLKAKLVQDVLMQHVERSNKFITVENTGEIIERKCFPYRRSLFRSEDNNYVCFNEEYIKLFKINKLVGIRVNQPFFALKGKTIWFAIMPCFTEDKKYGWKDTK